MRYLLQMSEVNSHFSYFNRHRESIVSIFLYARIISKYPDFRLRSKYCDVICGFKL